MHWERFPRHRRTAIPTCVPGSLSNGFLWSRWRGKRSRHSQRMQNPQFYASGKRPIPYHHHYNRLNQHHIEQSISKSWNSIIPSWHGNAFCTWVFSHKGPLMRKFDVFFVLNLIWCAERWCIFDNLTPTGSYDVTVARLKILQRNCFDTYDRSILLTLRQTLPVW